VLSALIENVAPRECARLGWAKALVGEDGDEGRVLLVERGSDLLDPSRASGRRSPSCERANFCGTSASAGSSARTSSIIVSASSRRTKVSTAFSVSALTTA